MTLTESCTSTTGIASLLLLLLILLYNVINLALTSIPTSPCSLETNGRLMELNHSDDMLVPKFSSRKWCKMAFYAIESVVFISYHCE